MFLGIEFGRVGGVGLGWPCWPKVFLFFLARARVYTRSFVFFSVTSVTGLRNKVSAFFDDVPLFPENEGLFSGNVGLFRENMGHFRENKGSFGGNELILWGKKLILGKEMASVIVV